MRRAVSRWRAFCMQKIWHVIDIGRCHHLSKGQEYSEGQEHIAFQLPDPHPLLTCPIQRTPWPLVPRCCDHVRKNLPALPVMSSRFLDAYQGSSQHSHFSPQTKPSTPQTPSKSMKHWARRPLRPKTLDNLCAVRPPHSRKPWVAHAPSATPAAATHRIAKMVTSCV